MKILSALFCGAFLLFIGVTEGSAASCSANPKNVVTNCGFETGSFLGWTLTGNDVPGELNNLYGVEGVDPIDNIGPNSGSYQAYVGDLATNPLTLSQTVATSAGQAYYITFDLAQDTPGTVLYPNTVALLFNGVSLFSQTNIGMEGYKQYTFAGYAAASSTVLSITLGNSLGEFLLDDVSVTLAPEPSTRLLAVGSGVLLGGILLFRRKQLTA